MGRGVTVRHILIVNVYFAPHTYGGATIVAEEVAHALIRQQGHRITAISLCSRVDLFPYAVIKTEVAGIVNYLINVPTQHGYLQAYDDPRVTACLRDLVLAIEPDVVHAHCLQGIGIGIFEAAEMARVPVVLSVHDFWWLCERQFMLRVDGRYCGQDPVNIEGCKGCVEDHDATRVRRSHLAQTGEKAAVITFPSRFAMDLSQRSGFGLEKGIVWQNGVRLPTAEFFAAQARRRARDGKLAFGYLGGPSHIKGWPQIRQAFAGLGQSDFRVFNVDGSLDGSWWNNSMFRGLPGYWQILPRFQQDAMDAFYAKIDVLLFMSQWKETYGLAIREALARGIRVIQTDSGGTVEHDGPLDMPPLPIGGAVDDLRKLLERTFAQHPSFPDPVAVQSFDAQAAELDHIIAGLC